MQSQSSPIRTRFIPPKPRFCAEKRRKEKEKSSPSWNKQKRKKKYKGNSSWNECSLSSRHLGRRISSTPVGILRGVRLRLSSSEHCKTKYSQQTSTLNMAAVWSCGTMPACQEWHQQRSAAEYHRRSGIQWRSCCTAGRDDWKWEVRRMGGIQVA